MRSQAKAPSAAPTRRRILVAISAALALVLVLGVSLANATVPTLTIEEASDVSYVSAKAQGTVDPEGFSTTYRFQYATQADFSDAVTAKEEVTEASETVNADLTGLAPSTTYYLRLQAENADGQGEAVAASTFTTLAVAAPEVIATDDASAVLYTTAKASGSVKAGGEDPAFNTSTCRFEATPQAQFETEGFDNAPVQAGCDIEPTGTGTTEVKADLGGLAPATVYHLRLLAANTGGSDSLEATNTFTTLAVTAPTVILDPPSALTDESVHLSGEVDPQGTAPAFFATCRFEYVTDAAYQPLDERQALIVRASAGSFTLGIETDSFQTTAPIAFNAPASGPGSVQAAIEALGNIGPGEVTVTGGPGDQNGTAPYEIAFSGALGGQNVQQFSVATGALTGTAYVITTVPGHVGGFEKAIQLPCEPGELVQSPEDVSVDLGGLEPSVTYHVRLHADNAGGSTDVERSFTTTGLAPTAITHLVANLRSDSARLTGFTDPQNDPTTYFFEWGKAADLSDAQSLPASEDASAGSGGEQRAVGHQLSGLSPQTTYYFRFVTQNASGTSNGEINSFTTRPTLPPMGSGIGAWGDRGIELVNSRDKGMQKTNIASSYGFSPDGNRAFWSVFGGTAVSQSGSNGQLLSIRGENGWQTRSATPPRFQTPFEIVALLSWTEDLSSFLVQGTGNIGFGLKPTQFFGFNPDSGNVEAGAEFIHTGTPFPAPYHSDDLSHVFFAAALPLVPEDLTFGPNTYGGIYDVGRGRLDLVSLLPGDISPACHREASLFYGNDFGNFVARQHLSSTSGDQVVFSSRAGDCSEAPQIYARRAAPSGDLGAGTGATTTLISGPAVSGPLEQPGIVQVTPDGTQIAYVTATRVTAEDSSSGKDLYRYVRGAGNECLTCLVPDADVLDALAAEDLSRIYFTSRELLAPGASAGQRNLYVWRDGAPDTLEYIAPAQGGLRFSTRNFDGSVLAFRATDLDDTKPFDASTLDQLTGDQNVKGCIDSSGVAVDCTQFYRYDDRDRSLECVSCVHERLASAHVNLLASNNASFDANALSDDGRTFIFSTTEALVPGDINGPCPNTSSRLDAGCADVYEWRDGRVGLLTGGRERALEAGAAGAGSVPIGVTPDGSNAFFVSPQQLVPGTDGLTQYYDARIGGGFREERGPTPCSGDGCRNAFSPVPTDAGAATPTFTGPGNRTARPGCAKGKVRKQKKCVKKKGARKRAGGKRGGGK